MTYLEGATGYGQIQQVEDEQNWLQAENSQSSFRVMSTFKRSLLSLSIAAGLIVSGTGVAAAQSSSFLPGSSFSTGTNDGFEGRWPVSSLMGKYETAYAKALKQKGLKQDEGLNEFAENVADDLADGTLQYESGSYVRKWQFSEDGTLAAEITRLTHYEAEAYLPNMSGLLDDLLDHKDPANDRLGYAVSSDDRYVYLVVTAPASI